jgi:acetyl-CoA carboxylase biotin carboxyl carrier protein
MTMTEEVRADVPGTVWKILVEVGDAVSNDDMLAILDSMKMEIPVKSETGGLVTQIVVREGDSVQDGDLIAVVEPATA